MYPNLERDYFGPKTLSYIENEMMNYLTRKGILPVLIPDVKEDYLKDILDEMDGFDGLDIKKRKVPSHAHPSQIDASHHNCDLTKNKHKCLRAALNDHSEKSVNTTYHSAPREHTHTHTHAHTHACIYIYTPTQCRAVLTCGITTV